MWAAVVVAAAVAAASDVEVYRDPTQPIPARVADLLSRMTLEEKAAQLGCECIVQNMLLQNR
jgi:beta-glucosidase